MLKSVSAALLLGLVLVAGAQAQPSGFHAGSYIPGFGPVASIEVDVPIPPDTHFRVAFDVAVAAAPGALNRSLVSAARFLNMHVEAGVEPDLLDVAVVVHGGAWVDMTTNAYYRSAQAADSANVALANALMSKGVRLILCGQSMANAGISSQELVPGVEVALSAMTAHALLQQSGYTLNPF